jgi:aminocarboxymuconate-semialdehyde decarboxylase
LRLFFADTAVQGNTANLLCARKFFGTDHLLFGTDFPFNRDISMALKAIDAMEMPPSDRERVLGLNAARVLKLSW